MARSASSLWRLTTSCQRVAPSATACAVDSTISVKRIDASDPGIVARRYVGDLAGAHFELDAVAHLDPEVATDYVGDVMRLAPLRSGDGLDIDRPSPTGRPHVSRDHPVI